MSEYETALDIVNKPHCNPECHCYDNSRVILLLLMITSVLSLMNRRSVRLDIVKSLLSTGTSPSCIRGGTAPLLVATDKGYTAIAKALLDARADTSTKVNGETAAKRAGRHRYKDIVTLVVMKNMERRKKEM